MDLAAGSGLAAAKVIRAALDAGDPSGPTLADYPAELARCFVGRDMQTYARAPRFFTNPRLYRAYGQLAADVLHGVYDLDTAPRRHLVGTGLRALRRSPVKGYHLAADAVAAMRDL
jgi:electron transfer flavoprotein-quinone oxidoreductase